MIKKRKILVIDDDEGSFFIIKNILEGTSCYDVSFAQDGIVGLQQSFCEDIDLIFLDFFLPEMRGDEIVDKLKKDGRSKDIPIVIISGLGDLAYIIEENKWKRISENSSIVEVDFPEFLKGKNSSKIALELGVKAYLPKPFDVQLLLNVVKLVLKNSEKLYE